MMAALRELPQGMLYVCSGGKEFLDHRGNVYVASPPTPHVAQEPPKPKPTPKPIALSESARTQIAAMLPELASKSAEHTLWCVTDGTGNLLEAFATSSGHDDRDASDHKASIERVVKTPGRKGLFLVHNHPALEGGGGDNKPSANDHTFTEWVKARIAPFGDVQLIDHQIVGARTTESRSIDAKDTPVEPLGRTEAWEHTITEAVRRLEAKVGITSQAPDAADPEPEPFIETDWHHRQRMSESEPHWLQQIRRRYAR